MPELFDKAEHMKTLSFLVFFLTIVSGTMAAPGPSPGVCKADLKAWAASKTETLTIKELNERMNTMFACADLSKKHEKQVRAYLGEFYRTHSELANRAFNFITRHGLAEQFGVEENGTASSQASSTAGAREQ
ncbi:MAG: hypothetical protein ACHQLQ_14270 [Candidatus Acidiferrales bacterium]